MAANVFGFTPPSLLAQLKNQSGGSGYVTLDTIQTITGQKTFDNDAIFNYNLYTQNLIASNNIQAGALTAGDIYPTNSIVFADGSSQITAYKSLTPGTYLTCDITVDANGAISAISSGTGGSVATYLYISTPPPGNVMSLCMTDTMSGGVKSVYTKQNSLTFNAANNTLAVDNATFTNTSTTSLSCSSFTSALSNPNTSAPFSIMSQYTTDMYVLGTLVTSFQSTKVKTYRPAEFYVQNLYDTAGYFFGTDTYQQILLNAQSVGGSWNPIVPTNAASIVARGTTQDNKTLAITLWSNTALGLLLSPTEAKLQFGNQYVQCDTSQLTLHSSNPVLATGFSLPSVNDNSSIVATTQWVQSVLSAGSGAASTVYMSDNTTSATSHALCYATGSPDGYKAIKQDYTGLTYTPSTNTLVVEKLNGLVVNATSSNVDVGSNRTAYSGADNTLVGNEAGRTTNTGYANNCFGSWAGHQLTGGHDNVCIGKWAGQYLTNGFQNILIGTSAGRYIDLESNNIMIGYNVNSGSNQQLSNTILIGNQITGPTTYTDDVIIIGTSSHTQYIKGQINYYSILYHNTTATGPANVYYTLPTVLPQVVFLKDDYTATFWITLPAPSMFYTGSKLAFRKTYPSPSSSINTHLTIAGGGYFVNYNTYMSISTEVFLDSGLCYVDMICDGTYWCVNVLI